MLWELISILKISLENARKRIRQDTSTIFELSLIIFEIRDALVRDICTFDSVHSNFKKSNGTYPVRNVV